MSSWPSDSTWTVYKEHEFGVPYTPLTGHQGHYSEKSISHTSSSVFLYTYKAPLSTTKNSDKAREKASAKKIIT